MFLLGDPLEQFILPAIIVQNSVIFLVIYFVILSPYPILFISTYTNINLVNNFVLLRNVQRPKHLRLVVQNWDLNSAFSYSEGPLFAFKKWTLALVKSALRSGGNGALKASLPMVYYMFFLCLAWNVMGLVPYSYTLSSCYLITIQTAFAIFLAGVFLGIKAKGVTLAKGFFPPGSPTATSNGIVPLETNSFLARIISLSTRIFANMMSGHTLTKILLGFSWAMLCGVDIILSPISVPLTMSVLTGLTLIESAVAFLQAYVFTLLSVVYAEENINSH